MEPLKLINEINEINDKKTAAQYSHSAVSVV